MIKLNENLRNKYIFHGFLANNAIFCGKYDIPYVESDGIIPDKVLPFSKIMSCSDFNYWIIFYEHDNTFEKFWKNPEKYLNRLKKFKGVVTPDFSIYGDMPFSLQIYNTYRQRVLGHWLKENGIKVIPNVRWCKEESYEFCWDGLAKNDIVFIGSHGCLKKTEDRKVFISGLYEMVKVLHPRVICVYGKAPDSIFLGIKNEGIIIKQFDSEFSKSHEVKYGIEA